MYSGRSRRGGGGRSRGRGGIDRYQSSRGFEMQSLRPPPTGVSARRSGGPSVAQGYYGGYYKTPPKQLSSNATIAIVVTFAVLLLAGGLAYAIYYFTAGKGKTEFLALTGGAEAATAIGGLGAIASKL